MQKVNEGGNESNYYVLTVDGKEYDFDSLIGHNDQKNTERKMEISVLFSGTVSENEVEKRLNEKIEKEW